MKKIYAIPFIFGTWAILQICAYAHGVWFEEKPIKDNKIRIYLNWQDQDSRGIYPLYFMIEKGKIVTVGYEVREKFNPEAYLDIDAGMVVGPIIIVPQEVSEKPIPVFKDIIGTFEEPYIKNLHGARIIIGRPNGNFDPFVPVTRAEFMTMILKSLNVEMKDEGPDFSDLNVHWGRAALKTGFMKGILKGFSDGTVKPDKSITFAECCAILDRSFQLTASQKGYYQKLKKGKWYSDSVKKVFDSSVATVDDPVYMNFEEDKPITRADMSVMLSRARTFGPENRK